MDPLIPHISPLLRETVTPHPDPGGSWVALDPLAGPGSFEAALLGGWGGGCRISPMATRVWNVEGDTKAD